MNAKAPVDPVRLGPTKPLNMLDKDFQARKFEYYAYLRDHLPVHQARIMGMKMMVCSRYEDCLIVVKDDRFMRNRARATGGRKLPFPAPGYVRLMAESMIQEDDPEHRRLRGLVQKAFAPKSLQALESGMTARAHELLDACLGEDSIELRTAYALPIPSRVIADMMGVNADDMPRFQASISALTEGMTGWSVVKTLLWDLRRTVAFVRELIERKRRTPGDDILTGLIEAEEDGDRLSEDELVAMTFLLIIAGFETTVHLIGNSVLTLTQHPEAMARLRAEPALMGSAVEELLRYSGPIHGTKPNYVCEDIELRGVTIPKGMPVMPLLGAANRDPDVFDDPETFNIQRDPNRHLSFSQGNHFCLGAFLARMETRVALNVLLERTSEIELAVPEEELELQRLPGWHRYMNIPVRLRV